MTPSEVLPVAEAREGVSKAVKRFREQGITADPVIFGSHRKPEAVTIPYEMFQALLPAIEDVLLAETLRTRLAEPVVTWDAALAELGITEEDVATVNLADFTITTDD